MRKVNFRRCDNLSTFGVETTYTILTLWQHGNSAVWQLQKYSALCLFGGVSGVLFRRCDPFPYSTTGTTSKTTKTATATAAAATTVTIAILTRVGHHVCDCLRLVQRRRPRLLVHPAEPAEALREHGLDAIEHLLQKNSNQIKYFLNYFWRKVVWVVWNK